MYIAHIDKTKGSANAGFFVSIKIKSGPQQTAQKPSIGITPTKNS